LNNSNENGKTSKNIQTFQVLGIDNWVNPAITGITMESWLLNFEKNTENMFRNMGSFESFDEHR